eukprot:COSAG01_NODE_1898_length_8965_cov_8.656366_8_plen_66_part_00
MCRGALVTVASIILAAAARSHPASLQCYIQAVYRMYARTHARCVVDRFSFAQYIPCSHADVMTAA